MFDATDPALDQPLRMYLGRGHKTPGVSVYEPVSGGLHDVLNLQATESVYALVAEDANNTAVVGTKAGLLHFAQHVTAGDSGAWQVNRSVVHGAPILSLCWIGAPHVVVSDTEGRCYVWNCNTKEPPQALPTRREAICALVARDQTHLMGLSTSGELLTWHLPTRQLTGLEHGPPPPAISALAKLTWWPAAEAMVYPARGGQLVTWRPLDDEVHTVDAHDGEFYAIVPLEVELLTIGLRDRCARLWRPRGSVARFKGKAPAGITSAALVGSNPARIIAINERGEACVCRLVECRLHVESRLPGGNYRVVVGPTWDELNRDETQRRRVEVEGLANAIRERMACNELDEVGILHERLAALGYQHVSLALRAAQARDEGDLLSELKAYAALVHGLPPHAAESRESFARYAGLLEATWQFEEALLFSQRAEALGADHDAPASRRLSTEYAKILRGGDWVVEPDLPLVSLIDAATAADKPFQGLFVLRTLGESRSRGAQLTPQAIVQKYDQERNKAGREPLPRARHRTVCWLTRNRREHFDLVLIEAGPKAGFAGLVFCVKVVNAGLQTVMVPAVLFKAPSRKATTSAVRHNQRVHQRLSNVSSAARANGWLDRVDRAMRCALRRLLTEELVR
ncbi:MAG: hypothetical protein KAY37_05620 [Phycisphaerae bacterium]|nr:hypothetical protein [Phycisphaerae bacterium]